LKIRLLALAGLATFALAGPLAASSSAFVCSPTVRPACDTVCSVTNVCRLFG
jgi:hypothetical protein